MEQASQSTGPIHAEKPGIIHPRDLPKDVREGIPPQSDLWSNAPGELVLKYEADPKQEALGMTGFSWQVRKLIPGRDFDMKLGQVNKPHYEASLPYRAIVYQGDTAEEALGNLLKGVCQLSREGAINPSNPFSAGSPPIQHAIHILTERLLLTVERRQDHLLMSGYAENPMHVGALTISGFAAEGGDDSHSAATRRGEAEQLGEQLLRAVSRDNEIVSALATAIASLARVKDL